MGRIERLLAPRYKAHAHCDLFCGVYDPAQAMIEAHSCLKSAENHASDDEVFRAGAIAIKEERAELVKHHLWVIWTDFFEPKHVEAFRQLHDLFFQATKAAGDAKKSMDPAVSQWLIGLTRRSQTCFGRPRRPKGPGCSRRAELSQDVHHVGVFVGR